MRISDWSSDVCSSDLLADDLEEGTQRDRVVDIRNSLAYLIEGLRQNGSAQTLLTKTQIDKNKCSVAYVGSQLRRQRGAHIGHRCECRHDQIGRASCRERVCPYV